MRILITGANRGIGAALATKFQAEGHEVLGTARGRDGFIPLDVANSQSIAALPDAIGQVPLDCLICNSGVYLDKGHTLDNGYAPDLWAQSFAVNVTGAFLTVQAVLPLLRAGQSPRVGIISSQMGSSARAPGGSYIYRASKAAATNLAMNLASELGREGIAVGAYHPGWVRTDMGGGSADISTEESAAGLYDRFMALGPKHTGVFETWDGRVHPF